MFISRQSSATQPARSLLHAAPRRHSSQTFLFLFYSFQSLWPMLSGYRLATNRNIHTTTINPTRLWSLEFVKVGHIQARWRRTWTCKHKINTNTHLPRAFVLVCTLSLAPTYKATCTAHSIRVRRYNVIMHVNSIVVLILLQICIRAESAKCALEFWAHISRFWLQNFNF